MFSFLNQKTPVASVQPAVIAATVPAREEAVVQQKVSTPKNITPKNENAAAAPQAVQREVPRPQVQEEQQRQQEEETNIQRLQHQQQASQLPPRPKPAPVAQAPPPKQPVAQNPPAAQRPQVVQQQQQQQQPVSKQPTPTESAGPISTMFSFLTQKKPPIPPEAAAAAEEARKLVAQQQKEEKIKLLEERRLARERAAAEAAAVSAQQNPLKMQNVENNSVPPNNEPPRPKTSSNAGSAFGFMAKPRTDSNVSKEVADASSVRGPASPANSEAVSQTSKAGYMFGGMRAAASSGGNSMFGGMAVKRSSQGSVNTNVTNTNSVSQQRPPPPAQNNNTAVNTSNSNAPPPAQKSAFGFTKQAAPVITSNSANIVRPPPPARPGNNNSTASQPANTTQKPQPAKTAEVSEFDKWFPGAPGEALEKNKGVNMWCRNKGIDPYNILGNSENDDILLDEDTIEENLEDEDGVEEVTEDPKDEFDGYLNWKLTANWLHTKRDKKLLIVLGPAASGKSTLLKKARNNNSKKATPAEQQNSYAKLICHEKLTDYIIIDGDNMRSKSDKWRFWSKLEKERKSKENEDKKSKSTRSSGQTNSSTNKFKPLPNDEFLKLSKKQQLIHLLLEHGNRTPDEVANLKDNEKEMQKYLGSSALRRFCFDDEDAAKIKEKMLFGKDGSTHNKMKPIIQKWKDRAIQEAIEEKRNVVLPLSFGNCQEAYQQVLNFYFAGYELSGIIFVATTFSKIESRIARRAEKTGRFQEYSLDKYSRVMRCSIDGVFNFARIWSGRIGKVDNRFAILDASVEDSGEKERETTEDVDGDAKVDEEDKSPKKEDASPKNESPKSTKSPKKASEDVDEDEEFEKQIEEYLAKKEAGEIAEGVEIEDWLAQKSGKKNEAVIEDDEGEEPKTGIEALPEVREFDKTLGEINKKLKSAKNNKSSNSKVTSEIDAEKEDDTLKNALKELLEEGTGCDSKMLSKNTQELFNSTNMKGNTNNADIKLPDVVLVQPRVNPHNGDVFTGKYANKDFYIDMTFDVRNFALELIVPGQSE